MKIGSFGRGTRVGAVLDDMITNASLGLHLSARIAQPLSRGRDEMGISGCFGKVHIIGMGIDRTINGRFHIFRRSFVGYETFPIA
jgi:hypothetical protein